MNIEILVPVFNLYSPITIETMFSKLKQNMTYHLARFKQTEANILTCKICIEVQTLWQGRFYENNKQWC